MDVPSPVIRQMMKWWAVAVVMLLVVACSPAAQDTAGDASGEESDAGEPADIATSEPADEVVEVVEVTYLLPFLRSIAFWPVHIAEELGYFEEEGLKVSSEATDGSSFVVQQVAANSAEFGIATAEPVLLGYEQNQNFQSVYEFLTGNVFDTWVLDESPVQSLDDLEPGDSIAIKDLAGGEVPGLNVQLRNVGLEPDVDVQYTQFGENTGLGASLLADEEVQAMTISWNSLVGVDVALEESGLQLRCISCDTETSLGSESVIVPNEFLTQNEDLVIGHGRALAKAALFGATNPEAALEIMKTVNPEEQVDADYAKAYFDAAVEIMQPRQPENLYGWHDTGAWTRSMELLLAPDVPSGLANEVDVEALVNNDLVEAYNDFDHDAVIQQAEEWTP
jgi:NitT/TauT family transport system substrate-binding protein